MAGVGGMRRTGLVSVSVGRILESDGFWDGRFLSDTSIRPTAGSALPRKPSYLFGGLIGSVERETLTSGHFCFI